MLRFGNFEATIDGYRIDIKDRIVLSENLMDLAAEMGVAIDAEELPPLEIPRRDPIKLFGVLLDTRLDFTHG